MDEFVLGDGTVSVRDTDGAFQPIRTPAGFTDAAFRNVVAATDTLYRLNGSFPSVKEIQVIYPKVTQQTISGILVTEEFSKALEYRGVNAAPDSGLSIEQQMTLLKLSDFTDKRPLSAKLKELGVPMPRYLAWMKQPLFAEMRRARAEDTFRDASTLALEKLMANMEQGDNQAIFKVLEITGRYNPAQQQIEDVRNLLVRIVEAVVRNVPDAEQRRAIMTDINAVTESHSILQTRQIEG